MRIIAGQWRGRRLRAPRGFDLRPTSDKVKGALFNILGADIEGARVMDLFAGTGSVGIEALSRGASHVTFVEEDPAARLALETNLEACGASPRQATVWTRGGVAGWISHLKRSDERAGVIFADPPYHRPETFRLLRPFAGGLGLSKGGWLVIEHFHTAEPPAPVTPMAAVKTYHYGETTLSISAKTESP
ncbi:MAG: 16S rRNA (guanine(966)-N(2))-methyltransferase RsmD [Nitrospiria bacterium]